MTVRSVVFFFCVCAFLPSEQKRTFLQPRPILVRLLVLDVCAVDVSRERRKWHSNRWRRRHVFGRLLGTTRPTIRSKDFRFFFGFGFGKLIMRLFLFLIRRFCHPMFPLDGAVAVAQRECSREEASRGAERD